MSQCLKSAGLVYIRRDGRGGGRRWGGCIWNYFTHEEDPSSQNRPLSDNPVGKNRCTSPRARRALYADACQELVSARESLAYNRARCLHITEYPQIIVGLSR